MGCGSLRELTDITTAHAKKSKHLGFGHQPINRQMLSKANALRDHMKMPITWEDGAQREYEVYVCGDVLMDTFAYVMEQVEYIGKEIVYR